MRFSLSFSNNLQLNKRCSDVFGTQQSSQRMTTPMNVTKGEMWCSDKTWLMFGQAIVKIGLFTVEVWLQKRKFLF